MNEKQAPAMTEQEVARRLSLSVATLRSWRLRRRGPRYVRFGRAVRYLASDIDRFVQSCAVEDSPVRGERPGTLEREGLK
jgi:predicted DNA-binding transcriptional regulator AlpA